MTSTVRYTVQSDSYWCSCQICRLVFASNEDGMSRSTYPLYRAWEANIKSTGECMVWYNNTKYRSNAYHTTTSPFPNGIYSFNYSLSRGFEIRPLHVRTTEWSASISAVLGISLVSGEGADSGGLTGVFPPVLVSLIPGCGKGNRCRRFLR